MDCLDFKVTVQQAITGFVEKDYRIHLSVLPGRYYILQVIYKTKLELVFRKFVEVSGQKTEFMEDTLVLYELFNQGLKYLSAFGAIGSIILLEASYKDLDGFEALINHPLTGLSVTHL